MDCPLLIGASGTGKVQFASSSLLSSGFVLRHTGAIYRCVALAARNAKVDFADEKGLKNLCSNLKLSFVFRNGINSIILDSRM